MNTSTVSVTTATMDNTRKSCLLFSLIVAYFPKGHSAENLSFWGEEMADKAR